MLKVAKTRECSICAISQPWKAKAANPDAEIISLNVQAYSYGPKKGSLVNAGSERVCQGCLAKAAAAPQSAHGRRVAELLLRKAGACLSKIVEARS